MSGVIARLREHPKGFWFVFSGELAERASYYGMRTLLAAKSIAYSDSASGVYLATELFPKLGIADPYAATVPLDANA